MEENCAQRLETRLKGFGWSGQPRRLVESSEIPSAGEGQGLKNGLCQDRPTASFGNHFPAHEEPPKRLTGNEQKGLIRA